MIDCVKTVRNRPFGEWNVVYYDAAKTTPAKLRETLRKGGCRRASAVVSEAVVADGVAARVQNPMIAPGDLLVIELEAPAALAGKPLSMKLPAGWKALSAKVAAGEARVYAQSSRQVKQGPAALELVIGERRLKLSCEVVRLVP